MGVWQWFTKESTGWDSKTGGGDLVEEKERRRRVASRQENDFKPASSGSPSEADLKKAKHDD